MNHSAKRVLDLLELMAVSEPMTMKEMGDALNIPKSSIFDLVSILHERDFLTLNDSRAKTYKLGVAAYHVGMAYTAQSDLYRVAHPILAALTESVGTTGYLAIEQQGELVYLDKSESHSPIAFSMKIGSRNHLHSTALGKAILAAKEEPLSLTLATKPLVKKTSRTITDLSLLFDEICQIRKRGYAIDNGEDDEFLFCLAAPIRDGHGKCVASISITSLRSTVSEEETASRADQLVAAAMQISRALGYQRQTLFA